MVENSVRKYEPVSKIIDFVAEVLRETRMYKLYS